jgi:hypothetical protein
MYDISAVTYSGVEFTVPMCRYTAVLKTAVWKVRDLGFYPFDMSLFCAYHSFTVLWLEV